MTRVKICGITNLEDAMAATACGANAIGLIFVKGTPRYVDCSGKTGQILEGLSPFIQSIAVYDDMADVSSNWECNFGAVQVYSNKLNLPLNMHHRIIRAFRIQDESDLNAIDTCAADCGAILLD